MDTETAAVSGTGMATAMRTGSTAPGSGDV